MRTLVALVLAAVLLAMPSAVAAAADSDEILPLRVEWFESREYPHVDLTVSLPPEMEGLGEEEIVFTVMEEGRRVEHTVERVSTNGLEVVLVFDTSGSMAGTPIEEAQRAATAFVGQMPTGAHLALVTFGAESEVVVDFTTSHATVTSAIGELVAAGETALYDGLIEAAGLFGGGEDDRRVIVMLSDGGDTVSSMDIDDAIGAAQEADAVFYAVELQSPENDPEPMQQIGVATAGTVVPVTNPAGLNAIFDGVAAAIINQYRLEFDASARGKAEIVVLAEGGGHLAGLTRIALFPKPPRTTPPATVAPISDSITVPAPEPFTIDLGLLASDTALVAGLGALFVGAAGLFMSSQGSSNRLPRPRNPFPIAAAAAKKGTFTDITDRATLIVEKTLESRDRKGTLDSALDQAGITLRAGEFGLLAISAMVAGYVLGDFASGPALGVVLAGSIVGIVRVVVDVRTSRRRALFHDQLGGTLQLMVGSLRAGFGLLQAIEAVAEESDAPTSEEFHRIKVEAQLGRDLQDSLAAMAERVGSDDIKWVVDAIAIHREIGGDLAEILDRAAATIRERDQLRRQVKALSAEGRLSAWVLLALPFGLAVVARIFNPDYLGELTGNGFGRFMIVMGLVLMTVGVFWIRKIVKVVF